MATHPSKVAKLPRPSSPQNRSRHSPWCTASTSGVTINTPIAVARPQLRQIAKAWASDTFWTTIRKMSATAAPEMTGGSTTPRTRNRHNPAGVPRWRSESARPGSHPLARLSPNAPPAANTRLTVSVSP